MSGDPRRPAAAAPDDPAFFRALVDNLYDGVYYVDRSGCIRYWNRGAERLTGYSADQVLGRRCSDNLLMHVGADGTLLCLDGCPLSATVADGSPREAEVHLHHRDGHRVPVRVRTAPLRAADGTITGAVEVFSDNSAHAAALQRVEDLRKMALLDHLTQVANRRFAEQALEAKLEERQRYGWPVGLLLFDVDHFKAVNDRYGHPAGDQVLKMVAATLASNARSFDLVARWGGEEFVAILTNVEPHQVLGIAERSRRLIEASGLRHDAGLIRVTVSVGATLAADGDRRDSLVARADRLLYAGKRGGRNRVVSDIRS